MFPKYNKFKEYLHPVVYFSLEYLCTNDQLKEKYINIPEKALKDIFTCNNIPRRAINPSPIYIYRNFDEIGSEYYPLVRMLKDNCVKSSPRVDQWLEQHRDNSIKSANKQ